MSIVNPRTAAQQKLQGSKKDFENWDRDGGSIN